MGMPKAPLRELVAGAYVDAQAAYARCYCVSQQDGTIRLGDDDEEGELQRFRSRNRVSKASDIARPDRRRVRRSANGKDKRLERGVGNAAGSVSLELVELICASPA
ncbi:hypothetical protein D3C87_1944340 [compost metagenome]